MDDAIRIISTRWFTDDLHRVPVDQQRRIRRRLGMLEAKGWMAAVADGTIEHLRDGIWEVRVLGKGAAYRVFFFPAPRRTIRMLVLTTVAAKSAVAKQRRLDLEIERARRRRDGWIAEHQEDDDEG